MELQVGLRTWSVELPPEKALGLARPVVPSLPGSSPRELIRAALEAPFGFEPLRRAIVPDDRITIVLDPELPHTGELLAGVLDHLSAAGIATAAVTVLTPPSSSQSWIDHLPDEFADVIAEIHDPADRKKLAYLATTKAGRRVYLNRTLIEADFVILLTGRRFDPVRGYSGAEVAVYPDLSDQETRAEHAGPFTAKEPWGGREEALEIAWLLGTPFLVQVIEGAGGTVQDVVAGLLDSRDEGRRRQDAHWRATLGERAEVVIATISGPSDRLSFLDLAKAAACAARAARRGGRVAVLTEAAPILGEGAELIRRLDEPRTPHKLLAREKPADWAACQLWCTAAGAAGLFLASGYPDDFVEELFATPIRSAAELQRLINGAEKVLVIPDAHRVKLNVQASTE